jgi:hypothetical protein
VFKVYRKAGEKAITIALDGVADTCKGIVILRSTATKDLP